MVKEKPLGTNELVAEAGTFVETSNLNALGELKVGGAIEAGVGVGAAVTFSEASVKLNPLGELKVGDGVGAGAGTGTEAGSVGSIFVDFFGRSGRVGKTAAKCILRAPTFCSFPFP